jgi:hypothetical protein
MRTLVSALWFEVTCHRGMSAAHHLSKLRPPKAATSRAQSKEGFAFGALRDQELTKLAVLVNLTPMAILAVPGALSSDREMSKPVGAKRQRSEESRRRAESPPQANPRPARAAE